MVDGGHTHLQKEESLTDITQFLVKKKIMITPRKMKSQIYGGKHTKITMNKIILNRQIKAINSPQITIKLNV